MPDQVPYLDEKGHKRYMKSETYIRNELQKELKVRDDIAEKLADRSEAGLIPRFIKAVNERENLKKYDQLTPNVKVLSMISSVKSKNHNDDDKVYFDNVSNAIAEIIKKITGINVKDFKVAIEARMIEHILKRHGENGQQDHSMSDDNDIAKLELALTSPNVMRYGGKTQAYTYFANNRHKTADTVLYEMYLGEDSYYIVQAVPDAKAKTLFIISAFIGEQGYTGQNKKGTSQLNDAKAPPRTPENDFVIVPNYSVSQKTDLSTPSDKNISEKEDSSYSFTPSQRDTEYLDAVNRGDMETAQRMVDEAAKEAGLIPRFIKAVNGERVADANKTIKDDTRLSYTPTENALDNTDAVGYNEDETRYSYNPTIHIGGYDYTLEQYNNFGWVRANNVINAGYWRNFTENFAQAVDGNYKYPKTKYGEFMIEIYDAYGNSEIADVIVFASGSIEVPKVTQVIKIDTTDPDEIEYERRDILEAGRRGIQQTAGEFFRFYYKTDSIGELVNEGTGAQKNRDSGGLNVKRRGSEIKTDPIVEFHVDEESGTIITVYRSGEVVKDMNLGEVRLVEVNGASRIYLFIADGYMSGTMYRSISNKRLGLYRKFREDFYNGVEQNREGDALWAEFDTDKAGTDLDVFSGFGYAGKTVSDDLFFEETSGSNGERYKASGGTHNYSDSEIDDLVRKAREAVESFGKDEQLATNDSEGKTVHIGFNQFVQQAEKMFTKSGESFTGTVTYNGKEYKANDIPRLAADLYLEMCAKKGYKPAYNIEGIADHPNYYKLLADFSLYDSKGHYAL